MVIVSVTMDLALGEGYTYAGGLGVLEGDKFYAAGRMGIDYIVITLFYRNGYVEYVQHNGELVPVEQEQPLEFLDKLKPLEGFIIDLKGEKVSVRIWEYTYNSARALFFEATSPDWARSLTSRIYIEGSLEEKFYKNVFLAKVAKEFIENRIGVENTDYVDLQEAHAAFLPLLLPIKDKYRLVIHTPGPWGHLVLPRELVEKEINYNFDSRSVIMTELGLSLVQDAFVVSAKQVDLTKKTFPLHAVKIRHVTNCIDLKWWMDSELRRLYIDKELDERTFRRVHEELRGKFIKYLKHLKGFEVDDERIIISYARRIASYKRPEFIMRFIEKNEDLPAIYVLSGKTHPQDFDGLKKMGQMYQMSRSHDNVFFLPNYDLKLAKLILQCSDLNIFTPFSGWEACGTSYMKAGVNGIPSLSSRDGGAIELIEDDFNGWLFGKDLRELIDIYKDPKADAINREDYAEFESKLSRIIEKYHGNKEGFYKVGLNAIKTFVPKVDINNLLIKYYNGVVKSLADQP
ncbi:MAG: glycogen/starch/alpha-glucan phosphorylase [Nitrososphaerales archaeon]|nr:glycogen/starch/alpha-glucan phosphorylase [Nitrososphaerales archaeon]